MRRHIDRARLRQPFNVMWISELFTIQGSIASFHCGIWFLYHVDPVQQTIVTACCSHWKAVTRIATALFQIQHALLRGLPYWLWSTSSVMSANQLIHYAMRFCSSLFGIVHYLAKSSRVLISPCRLFTIGLIDALVRVKSSLQHCFAAFPCSSRYWNTTSWAYGKKPSVVALSWFNCRYTCLKSVIAVSGS